LKAVRDRLERTAEAAEVDKQRLAVASLSGQQLRVAETRAKLGGVGRYASPQTEKGRGQPFVLTIHLDGQTIAAAPMPPDDAAFNAIAASPLSIGADSQSLENDVSEDQAG